MGVFGQIEWVEGREAAVALVRRIHGGMLILSEDAGKPPIRAHGHSAGLSQ